MNELDEIKERLIRMFDQDVCNLSQEDYREILEELISDLESRLDCVKEELEAQED